MARLYVKLTKDSKANKFMSITDTTLKRKASRAVTEATFEVRRSIRRITPIDTGNLRANIDYENVDDLSSRIYVDEGNAPYAIFVYKGTRPHVIRGNPYLFWPNAEHPVREVQHPGTAPNPFFDRGVKNSLKRVDLIVDKIMKELV